MKLVVVAALVLGCGSSKPDNGELVIPKTAESTSGESTSGESTMAVQGAGFNDEGKKAMIAGNYALASEHFRAAVARVPEAKYFFNLCMSLFQEGRFSEALTSCDAVEKNSPTPELSEKAKNLIAKINAEASKQGIAMTAPPNNDPVVPDSSTVPTGGTQAALAAKLSDEGVQLMHAHKYAEATMKFRDAVARVPEPKYFFNLCTSLFQEGKFSEGLTACSAVEKNHPTAALQTKANKMIERIQAEAKAQGISLRSP